MPIFMFLSQFLEILQGVGWGGGGGCCRSTPHGHNNNLNTPAQIGLNAFRTILYCPIIFLYAFFCPGTMTTQGESINSDLQRGLDRQDT